MMKNHFESWGPFLFLLILGCGSPTSNESVSDRNAVGEIVRLDKAIDALIPEGASLEILAEGFEWSEGPLWLGDYLIFSDVPANKVYKWSEAEGVSVYLDPSGYLGLREDKREPGSNGLALDVQGRLVLCQHGERQVARMASSLDRPMAAYVQIVNNFSGQRFNSPNDIVFTNTGEFYFTDPPYGLDDWDDKQLAFQGVYRVDNDKNVVLLIDSLSRPNGIALSPTQDKLYIAVSDPKSAKYYEYDLNGNGLVTGGRVLLDVTDMIGPELPGLPDGLKVDKRGNLWATGPGGVLVISPKGEHLGTISTGVPTANCAFNWEESALYITADSYLMRIKLKESI